MRSDLIYLAGPYSHQYPDVRQARYVAHCTAAANLMRGGARVFSPIAHGHAICDAGGLDEFSHEFWMRQCLPMLSMAERLVVLQLPGWLDSKGTAAEVDAAISQNIDVEFMEP
jgi:hypothetical protein